MKLSVDHIISFGWFDSDIIGKIKYIHTYQNYIDLELPNGDVHLFDLQVVNNLKILVDIDETYFRLLNSAEIYGNR
jgi:hypothetical protein